jgi:hypothetical protein
MAAFPVYLPEGACPHSTDAVEKVGLEVSASL